MKTRYIISLISVTALFFAGATALRAEDPGASLIENKSGSFYQVRISDNALPIGVVKLLDAESGAVLKEMKSKDEAYLMKPNSKLKMVIGGSPSAKGLAVALYVSLDLMKGDNGKDVDKKSVVRLHFTHALLGSKLIADPSGKLQPVTIDKENESKIITKIGSYQKATDGNLWEIKP